VTQPPAGQPPFPHHQPGGQPLHGAPYGPGQPGQAPQPGPQGPFPGQFDQPGGFHAAGGPAEPAPKKKLSVRNIISIVIGIAVLGSLAFQFFGDRQREQALQVGSCVSVSGAEDDTDVKAADCDGDAAEGIVFHVIEVHEGGATCDQPMVQYTEVEEKRGSENTNKTVCLGEVLKVDECYETFDGVAGLRSVDCPGGEFQVTQREDAESLECAADEFLYAYEKWPRAYCLAELA
jgi:hypothetical protein